MCGVRDTFLLFLLSLFVSFLFVICWCVCVFVRRYYCWFVDVSLFLILSFFFQFDIFLPLSRHFSWTISILSARACVWMVSLLHHFNFADEVSPLLCAHIVTCIWWSMIENVLNRFSFVHEWLFFSSSSFTKWQTHSLIHLTLEEKENRQQNIHSHAHTNTLVHTSMWWKRDQFWLSIAYTFFSRARETKFTHNFISFCAFRFVSLMFINIIHRNMTQMHFISARARQNRFARWMLKWRRIIKTEMNPCNTQISLISIDSWIVSQMWYSIETRCIEFVVSAQDFDRHYYATGHCNSEMTKGKAATKPRWIERERFWRD